MHYVTKGTGPLVVLIHGIPGWWYDWRSQLPALARHFQVVAIDQRNFNRSVQPDGVENYTLDKLVSDLDAVVIHFGQEKATLSVTIRAVGSVGATRWPIPTRPIGSSS
jgi:pimeloyl-ACP methyl ester carboxylesterase